MTTETEIKIMLDELADYQAGRDAIAMAKQAAIDAIMTPEIRQQLNDIDAEFADKSSAVDEKIIVLTEDVKIQVGALGQSVKGQFLHAVWNKGRESWDGKLLAGFALAHPEILTARKVGEPTVSLRTAK
jgi:DNA-binding TFAR19-related protein (PDSD5 family)